MRYALLRAREKPIVYGHYVTDVAQELKEMERRREELL
jgi:hypothetical protein